ncbi:MAG: biopolymer transporter ExbD [Pseudomonadota bacterium]
MRISRSQEEEFRPDLTPMVDVIFQLVIFFMVSSVFVSYTRQMGIEVPESTGKNPTEQVDNLTIEITREKQVFLNGEEIALADLLDSLQSKHVPGSVVIRADRNLSYGLVMKVIEICESAGVSDIRTAIQ